MRRAGTLVALLLVASCHPSPEQIARDTCPLIAVTPKNAKMQRLKLLIDQGMNAGKAADTLDRYEYLIEIGATFDERKLCEAAVQEKKEEVGRIVCGAEYLSPAFNRKPITPDDIKAVTEFCR